MTGDRAIQLDHFSDVLCVWAYVSQVRVDELRRKMGGRLRMRYRFIPVFGDPQHRIGHGWADRGGFGGYADHVQDIAARFPHAAVDRRAWREVVPRSSAAPHHFLKAIQLLEDEGLLPGRPDPGERSVLEEASWRVRTAFFRDALDVSRLDVLEALARELSLPAGALRDRMCDGSALAALCRDIERRDELRVEGSPTYVLNEGRQKLYGNVGYNVLRANVEELESQPGSQASWC